MKSMTFLKVNTIFSTVIFSILVIIPVFPVLFSSFPSINLLAVIHKLYTVVKSQLGFVYFF